MQRKYLLLTVLLLLSIPFIAYASHSWANYHIPTRSIALGDNVDGSWDSYFSTAVTDWDKSVLTVTSRAGSTNGRRCRADSGAFEVCNAAYGYTGWLGVAQIWLDSSGHIDKGVAKMNDSYFSSGTYNTPAWRALVMCQEIGHLLGLGHNDEDFNTTNGTCMDYSSNPEPNQHPDQHDYDMLAQIYNHDDGGGSGGGDGDGEPCRGGPKKCPGAGNNGIPDSDFNNPSEWGQLIRQNGRVAVYERDFGNAFKMVTFVTWAN